MMKQIRQWILPWCRQERMRKRYVKLESVKRHAHEAGAWARGFILGAAPVRECPGISRRRLAECLVLFGVDVTRQPTRGGRQAGASFDLFPGAPQRTAEWAPAGPTTHATTGNIARQQQLHHDHHDHRQSTNIEYRPARLLLPHTAHLWAALMPTPREHGAA
jgi:hypothetical protein